jgi:acetyl-CoA/propionyl-CoA/long-chain acyl-CoA carboxylase, biotin carboxylase, biotin carboxyl carrier protein
VHTRWIETEFENTIEPWQGTPGQAAESQERERIVVEVGGKRLEVSLPAGFGAGSGAAGGRATAGRTAPKRSASHRTASAASGDTLTSPMQGTIVKVAVEEGQTVAAGDLVVVLEAMKMEQPLTAHKAGTVTGLVAQVGQTVTSGAVICTITA